LPHFANDPQFIQMFFDEAKITSQFNHPNIAQVHEISSVEDIYYIALEFVRGLNFRRLRHLMVDYYGLPPLELVAGIASQIASGLHHAHCATDEYGNYLAIVHRDVSPNNLLLSFEGNAKLVDFGVAKATIQSHQTSAGTVKGKYRYMSPEQIQALPIDHRSDIYALGAVIYELATGVVLFKRTTEAETIRAVYIDPIIPPSVLLGSCDPEFERIVMRALERDPDDRYQTADELRYDLECFMFNRNRYFGPAQIAFELQELFAQFSSDPNNTELYGKPLSRHDHARFRIATDNTIKSDDIFNSADNLATPVLPSSLQSSPSISTPSFQPSNASAFVSPPEPDDDLSATFVSNKTAQPSYPSHTEPPNQLFKTADQLNAQRSFVAIAIKGVSDAISTSELAETPSYDAPANKNIRESGNQSLGMLFFAPKTNTATPQPNAHDSHEAISQHSEIVASQPPKSAAAQEFVASQPPKSAAAQEFVASQPPKSAAAQEFVASQPPKSANKELDASKSANERPKASVALGSTQPLIAVPKEMCEEEEDGYQITQKLVPPRGAKRKTKTKARNIQLRKPKTGLRWCLLLSICAIIGFVAWYPASVGLWFVWIKSFFVSENIQAKTDKSTQLKLEQAAQPTNRNNIQPKSVTPPQAPIPSDSSKLPSPIDKTKKYKPHTTSPKSPRTTSPKSPRTTPPKSPRTTPPKSPRKTSLKSLQKTPPKSPRKTSPKSLQKTPPKSPRKTSPKSLQKTPPKSSKPLPKK
jgi:serine/threonine protein kinase